MARFLRRTARAGAVLAAMALPAPATSVAQTAAPPALGAETIDPGEPAFIDFITKATIDRLQGQFPPGKQPVLRDAHPKTHVLVRAQFIVLDDVPQDLRHGVFARPRSLDALIRFSAGGIEVQSDTVPQANGMAIKLFGVEGTKILEKEQDATTQDFVMINNFPSFFVRNLADYQAVHEALGAEDPTKGTAKFFASHPEELRAVMTMRGSVPLTSPFQGRYWSQTPIRLGPQAIKFSANPVSVPPATPGSGPDFLAEIAGEQLAQGDIYFDFLVQTQTDAVAMPIEDSLVVWDEAKSPFRRVALIRIPKQPIGARSKALAEQLSFNPWHALPEHRPIGAIDRARKAIYEALAEFRHGRNGVPRGEPRTIPALD